MCPWLVPVDCLFHEVESGVTSFSFFVPTGVLCRVFTEGRNFSGKLTSVVNSTLKSYLGEREKCLEKLSRALVFSAGESAFYFCFSS